MLSYRNSTQKVSPGNTKHKRIPHSFGIFLFSEQLYKIPGEADFKVEITLCWVWNSLMLNMKLFMTEIQLVCPIVYKTFVYILNSERKFCDFFLLFSKCKKRTGSRVSKCHGLMVLWPRRIFLSLRKILRSLCANNFLAFTRYCRFFF